MKRCILQFVLMLVACVSAARGQQPAEPLALMLSWQRDPTTTMTIDWHALPVDGSSSASLQYQQAGDNTWRQVVSQPIPFEPAGRIIHRVELTGLEPGTTYQFQIAGLGKIHSFRTMPRDLSHRPVVFALGGDTGPGHAVMKQVNEQVMTYDPDFIVWCGDLAHDDGQLERWPLWDQWFKTIQQTLVTPRGRMVPIVLGIGNHELNRKRGGNHYYLFPEFKNAQDFHQYPGDIQQWRRDNAPFFYGLFAFPGQPGYGLLDFGSYLTLFMMDSDHTNPVEGPQTQWLEKSLAERSKVTHRIPVSHVAAYPSVRPFEGRTGQNIRTHWSPLYEKHGVKIAFEHHEHSYKRTAPIRDGKEDPQGVVYLGDGPWGSLPRDAQPLSSRWYLSHTRSQRHAMIVTLGPEQLHVQAINAQGQVVDQYPYPQVGLDRTGLRDADRLAGHIAALLQDPEHEMRAAGSEILAILARTYQPAEPDGRTFFLKELMQLFTSIDDAAPASRSLAYQLLLMHADYLNDAASTRSLLEAGLQDPVLTIRELAREVSSLDPRKDTAPLRQALQAIGHEAVIQRRELLLAQDFKAVEAADAESADASPASPHQTHRLPARGWKLQWDLPRTGHLQQWFSPTLDDSAWEPASIQTPWTTPLDGEPHVGIAWYRLRFKMPLHADGARWSIRFEGVDESAWVWVDGLYVGMHDLGARGYDKPFELPVSSPIVPGKEHVLTVRVKNTRGVGGIWLPVSLLTYVK